MFSQLSISHFIFRALKYGLIGNPQTGYREHRSRLSKPARHVKCRLQSTTTQHSILHHSKYAGVVSLARQKWLTIEHVCNICNGETVGEVYWELCSGGGHSRSQTWKKSLLRPGVSAIISSASFAALLSHQTTAL